MKFTNNQIYELSLSAKEFDNSLYIPARANFFINKNLQTITNAGMEIEKSRIDIIKHYGIPSEDGTQYHIPQDKLEEVNKELIDLLEIEQELDIKMISIDDLKNVEISGKNMQAIMFMIED